MRFLGSPMLDPASEQPKRDSDVLSRLQKFGSATLDPPARAGRTSAPKQAQGSPEKVPNVPSETGEKPIKNSFVPAKGRLSCVSLVPQRWIPPLSSPNEMFMPGPNEIQTYLAGSKNLAPPRWIPLPGQDGLALPSKPKEAPQKCLTCRLKREKTY